jgi:acetyl-CoA carboxylase biotin carboxyl carrier protein
MAKKKKSGSGGGTKARGIDLAEVERLLAFMQKEGLEEFEYERSGVHIHLRKASTSATGGPGLRERSLRATAAVPGAVGEGQDAGSTGDAHVIKSPIVGTFYAAPGPDAAPFVKVGSHVEKGQALCIIEAMKLMNEIESDLAGEVVKIFIENGKPVEYGQPLFAIRPQGKK